MKKGIFEKIVKLYADIKENDDYLLSHILDLFNELNNESDFEKINSLQKEIFDTYHKIFDKNFLIYRILKEVVLSDEEKLNLLPLFFTKNEGI